MGRPAHFVSAHFVSRSSREKRIVKKEPPPVRAGAFSNEPTNRKTTTFEYYPNAFGRNELGRRSFPRHGKKN